MTINIHFLADDGKKTTGQVSDTFTHQDFVHMVNSRLGSNSHTFVVKGKQLCADDEVKFQERKKLITNSINVFVGRRMHGRIRFISVHFLLSKI